MDGNIRGILTTTTGESVGVFLQKRQVWTDEVRWALEYSETETISDLAHFFASQAQAEGFGMGVAWTEVQREGQAIAFTRAREVLRGKACAHVRAGAGAVASGPVQQGRSSQYLRVRLRHRALCPPALQQLQKLLVKLGLHGWRSTASRQDSQSQSLLAKVKLDRLGPEQYARPAPPPQSLLVKFGLPESESSGGDGPS